MSATAGDFADFYEPIADERDRLPADVRAALKLAISMRYEEARRALPPAPCDANGRVQRHESPFSEINASVGRSEPVAD